MFGFFNSVTDGIENVLTIADCVVSGEAPSKRQIAKLISDGVSIYVISSATGVAVDVLQSILND